MRERALCLTLVCGSTIDVTIFGAPHLTSIARRGSTPTGEVWAANLLRKVFEEDASAFSKYASSLPEFPVRIERNPDFQTASPNKLGPGGLTWEYERTRSSERPGVAWHSGTTEHFPVPDAVHQVQRARRPTASVGQGARTLEQTHLSCRRASSRPLPR
jgi:hypothetical protein